MTASPQRLAPEEPAAPEAAEATLPLIQVGWVLPTDIQDLALLDAYEEARARVHTLLADLFPQFHWEMPLVRRHRYPPHGPLDPLELLELGLQEKIHFHWDFSLVVTPNDLHPRQRISTLGVPSSALEVAVMSSALLGPTTEIPERLAGLALHMLGHLWGLGHDEQGPMLPPESPESLSCVPFTEAQQIGVLARLEEVADERLEEEQARWGWLSFHWRTFWTDPQGIWLDIWDYAPWRLPLRMGRMTAATAVSIFFLLLGAESWEVGTHLSTPVLVLGALVTMVGATAFVFAGQNLGQISREVGWREQLVRSRMVIFGTLLLGIVFLWLFLFVTTFLIAALFPDQTVSGWAGVSLGGFSLLRHAAFMATVGVLAGALGGNLEEEEEIKADLLYDEET